MIPATIQGPIVGVEMDASFTYGVTLRQTGSTTNRQFEEPTGAKPGCPSCLRERENDQVRPTAGDCRFER